MQLAVVQRELRRSLERRSISVSQTTLPSAPRPVSARLLSHRPSRVTYERAAPATVGLLGSHGGATHLPEHQHA